MTTSTHASRTAARAAMTDAEREAATYARMTRLIEAGVATLNEVLGLTDADHSHKVTFGYIGNCSPSGANDDRRWYVFLPHPGRVGTMDDTLGGFSTGNASGAHGTLSGPQRGHRGSAPRSPLTHQREHPRPIRVGGAFVCRGYGV